MSGAIRPATAGELQKTEPKKVKVADPIAVLPASRSQEVAQPTPPPFPALLNAHAGIEAFALEAMVTTSANLRQNVDTLITALKEGLFYVDNLGAAEIAVNFYPTQQVRAMYAMQQALPSHCPPFIPRYFALERKGAAHVTVLSSKVSTQGSLDEMPLFRFLPLCVNLRRLEVEIEIIDEGLYLKTIPSLSKILNQCRELEEFKLTLCKKKLDRSVDCDSESFIDILIEMLEVLLQLPKIKTIQLASSIPEYTLIAEIHEAFHDKLINQLTVEQKNQYRVILVEDQRTELRKFLSRTELEKCLKILTGLIPYGVQKECIQALTELVPEIRIPSDSNQQINLEEINIYFLEKGKIELGFWQQRDDKITFQKTGFPSPEVKEGYLSIIYKS